MAEMNRLRRRKLSSGTPQLINSSDEEDIAKAIEEKATYHGRRHDTVMYTNRRVKIRDLKAVANYHLARIGKKASNLQQQFGTDQGQETSKVDRQNFIWVKDFFALLSLPRQKTRTMNVHTIKGPM